MVQTCFEGINAACKKEDKNKSSVLKAESSKLL